MISNQYKKYFYVLTHYLETNKNIKIIQKPGVEDAWYPMLNVIYVNQNLQYRERLFTLLHEAGHAFIDNEMRHKDILCFNKNTPQKIRSKKSYVHTLNEEILAWNYGKTVGKKSQAQDKLSSIRRVYDRLHYVLCKKWLKIYLW